MKIRLIPPVGGGDALTLGDDDRAVGKYIRDYSPDLPSRLRTDYFFDSDYPEIVSEGFTPNTRRFIVDEEHDTDADAFLFSEQHSGQVYQEGTLEISSDGGAVTLPATRESVKLIARTGKTTIFQYSFLCGEVSLEPIINP